MNHIILAGLAETGLTAAEDIKLDSNTKVSNMLELTMLLACRINLIMLKDKLLNKLPSLASLSIIRGCEQSQLLFTNKPLASYFLP
jgi:hypothetical protein